MALFALGRELRRVAYTNAGDMTLVTRDATIMRISFQSLHPESTCHGIGDLTVALITVGRQPAEHQPCSSLRVTGSATQLDMIWIKLELRITIMVKAQAIPFPALFGMTAGAVGRWHLKMWIGVAVNAV